jgi:DNA gyrase subunit A
MDLPRPDIETLDPTTRAYVEALEAEVARLGGHLPHSSGVSVDSDSAAAKPPERPTSMRVITVSRSGLAKRTPRHLYSSQRRGGMGVFDLVVDERDEPAWLLVADADKDDIMILTDRARTYRVSVSRLQRADVNGRGRSLHEDCALRSDEQVALVVGPAQAPYLALLTERGHVRWLGGHLVGEKLPPGTPLYESQDLGAPAAACWAHNADDLFVATGTGKAIRFSARTVSMPGCLAIRLDVDDTVRAVVPVRENSGLLLLGADGKGSVRLMEGFRANKEPGGSGKIALKTERLAAACLVEASDDILAVSRLGKTIRFAADEIPAKTGAVQGVNCMALRSDEVTAAARLPSLEC